MPTIPVIDPETRDLHLGAVRLVDTAARPPGGTHAAVEMLRSLHAISPGAAAVVVERARQVVDEGYTAEHDDEHDSVWRLIHAARCLARSAEVWANGGDYDPEADIDWPGWPWHEEPALRDAWDDAVRAAALLIAALDMMAREGARAEGSGS